MKKVKGYETDDFKDLMRAIKDLYADETIEVLDIKYSSAISHTSYSGYTSYSCIAIYKDKGAK